MDQEQEALRLAELARCQLLDTPSEPDFDELARLAALLCQADMASLTLVDETRQWTKARYGHDVVETAREESICQHVVASGEYLEVLDAAQDPRFRALPLVRGGPRIRHYAGAPVTVNGHHVGVLCVLHATPRELDSAQRQALIGLAGQVSRQIKNRLKHRQMSWQIRYQESIVRNASLAIISTSVEGVITHFNHAAEELLGYRAAEMVGNETPGLFHDPQEIEARATELCRELGRDIKPGFEVFVARARLGEAEEREWTYIDKKATRIPVSLTVNALYDENRMLVGFVGFARDLRQLRTAEARLRDLFEHCTDLIQGVSPTGQVLFTNRAWQRTLGYTEDEALSLNIFQLLHPDVVAHCQEVFERLLAGEDVGLVRASLVARDGRRIEVEGNINARFEHGQPVSTRAIFRDVTAAVCDQRQQEELGRTLLALRESGADPACLTETVARVLPVERVGLWSLSRDEGLAHCVSAYQASQGRHLSQAPRRVSELPLYFGALEESIALAADRWEDHPALVELRRDFERVGITSSLSVPIHLGERLVGMLCCDHVGPSRHWTNAEIKFVSAVASQSMLELEQQERLRAEAALRVSEERHRLLIHGCRDAMMTLHPPEWRFSSCNPAALELFDVATEEQWKQLGPWDLSPELQPDGSPSGPQAQAMIAQALREGSSFFEWTHRRWRGESFPATVLLTALELGEQTFLQATVRDITIQKRAEEALRDNNSVLEKLVAERTSALAESERFLRASLDALSAQIAVLDGTGKILATNNTWSSGGEGDDYLQACDQQAELGVTSARQAASLIREVIAGRRQSAWYETCVGGEEDQRNHLCRITRFPGDGPLRVVLAHEDITESVSAEQRMRQALATLDAMDDGALIFALDGLRVTYANQGALRLTGYSREEILSLTLSDFDVEDAEEPLSQRWAPLLRQERDHLQLTAAYRCKNGQSLPVEASLTLDRAHPDRLRVIAIVRDISQRLQSERKERRTQRLESLGTLAGGVAHDLNNTLTPILISAELLRADVPPESEEFLEVIEEAAHRGSDMVKQLLAFAQGDEGERQPLQVTYQLKDIEKIIRSTFDKAIRLECRHAPDLGVVLGDATQLHQVFLNLCVNARDAMPAGGTLTVATENVTVDAVLAAFVDEAAEGSYVRVTVGDTGVGIPAEILDRIFEPFFTTKDPDKGTGLGLSTVLGIVKGHGGFLRVQSRAGQGTTFEVYLPAVAQPSIASERFQPQLEVGHGELVLVVDDEQAIRTNLARLLAVLGCQALGARDGLEALQILEEKKGQVSLLLTDINMPRMDGISLVREVRRLLPEMPVIAMTGLQEEGRMNQLTALGVTRHIGKPFTVATLAEALREALAGPRSIAPSSPGDIAQECGL